MFNAAREADYDALAKEVRGLATPSRPKLARRHRARPGQGWPASRRAGAGLCHRLLRSQWARDSGRADCPLAASLGEESAMERPVTNRRSDLKGRVWVTRQGVYRRSDRLGLADPALHRSRGAVQVRPRQGLRARGPASCVSTCSRPSTPTRATAARSKSCWPRPV